MKVREAEGNIRARILDFGLLCVNISGQDIVIIYLSMKIFTMFPAPLWVTEELISSRHTMEKG